MTEAAFGIQPNRLRRLLRRLIDIYSPSGKEEEGDGAERLARDFHFPWAIIAEPTDLRPCLSHYGYLEIQLFSRGQRLHASLANRRQNPVQSMLSLLLRLTRYLQEERPESVYNIRDPLSARAGGSWCPTGARRGSIFTSRPKSPSERSPRI